MMYDRFDMYVFGPVHMLLLGALLIIPFWQLFSKAGYSGWWSFLMIVPLVNVIALYVLAFSSCRHWRSHEKQPMLTPPRQSPWPISRRFPLPLVAH